MTAGVICARVTDHRPGTDGRCSQCGAAVEFVGGFVSVDRRRVVDREEPEAVTQAQQRIVRAHKGGVVDTERAIVLLKDTGVGPLRAAEILGILR